MVEQAHFVDAGPLDALSAEQCVVVAVGHQEVGLVLHEGRPVAVLNYCPHFGGPLALGPISTRRGEIICPWHRFRFKLSDGQSATNPAMFATVLPTEVRDGRVYVDTRSLAEEAS